AGPWLKDIDVPTLIVAGENDQLTPLSLSHRMRDDIRGAELLLLPKGSHAGIIEHPELISLRLEKFLRQRIVPFLAARAGGSAAPAPRRHVAPRRRRPPATETGETSMPDRGRRS